MGVHSEPESDPLRVRRNSAPHPKTPTLSEQSQKTQTFASYNSQKKNKKDYNGDYSDLLKGVIKPSKHIQVNKVKPLPLQNKQYKNKLNRSQSMQRLTANTNDIHQRPLPQKQYIVN